MSGQRGWATAATGLVVAVACAGLCCVDAIGARQSTLPVWKKRASDSPETVCKGRRCTVKLDQTLAGSETPSSVREGGWSNQTSRHRRQNNQQQTCSFGTSSSLNSRLTNQGNVGAHTIGLLGGLTIEWAGGSHPEMLVVASVSTEDFLRAQIVTNLFTSYDNGDTFIQADGVTGRVTEAMFSMAEHSIGADNYYIGYAVPGPEVTPNGLLYVSFNGGRAWTSLTTPNNAVFVQVSPHPTIANKILAADEKRNVFACTIQPQSMACNLLDANVISFEWAERGAAFSLVYLTITDSGNPGDALSFVRWAYAGESNAGRKVIKTNVANFESKNQYVFLTDIPSGDASYESTLWVSSDLGATFQPARFPFEGRNNHYAVVDASEDFVMVAVDHNKTRAQGSTIVNIRPPGGAVYNISAYRALFSEMIPEAGTPFTDMYYDPSNLYGCPGSTMSSDMTGKIAVLHRGNCKFYLKAQMAEAAGAIGVIIVNSVDSYRLYMQAPEGVSLPNVSVVIVSSSDGKVITDAYTRVGPSQANFQEVAAQETVLYRQSNLYASDKSGIDFSISLKNVLYEASADTGGDSGSYTDVYKVESMNGTYIANYRNSDGKELTVITYDKGAYWWSLKPPGGQVTHCSTSIGDCVLRLVLESTNVLTGYPMPQSTSAAMGIIVANAWVQDGDGEDPFTVISRDGGQTWNHLEAEDNNQPFTLAHNYRILDHGAAIVFAQHRQATPVIEYSLDEGSSGLAFQLPYMQNSGTSSDRAIIQGIVAEPGGQTTIAFAYYVYDNQWQGYKLDFQNLLGAPCDANSYTSWIPTTPSPNADCLLGQHFRFVRRNPCALCLNSEAERQATDVFTCPCANQDFRCVTGLHRPDNVDASGPISCVLDHDAASTPCNHGGMVIPYTLISDDMCTGAQDSGFLTPVHLPCRSSASVGEEIGKAFGYLVAAALISVLLIGFVFTFSKDARETAIAFFGTDGPIGNFLLRFNCFRHAEGAYIYSKLNDQTDALFEEDEDSDAHELGLYGDEDEDGDGHDDDDMLFSMADDNQGLPIADY
eukprot:m.22914 g.22914  ORF g.22914 m.22914 type:complete len:1048 (+) comp4043_c0_seq1:51-3194(+)